MTGKIPSRETFKLPEGIDGKNFSNPEINPAKRGFSIRYKNKTLLSTIDPIAYAEKTAHASVKSDRTLYFCPSPLFGYGLDVLISHISQDSAILCVEADDILFYLSVSSIDKRLLNHPCFALTGLKDGMDVCRFVREKWGPRAFRRVEAIKLSGGWQLNNSTYETIETLLCDAIAVDWGNAMTLIKLGRRYIRNTIRNLPLLINAKHLHELSFGSKPVLVLGAGPSLDLLLDRLKESSCFKVNNNEKTIKPFVLVCVDSCLPLLKERNIIPDLAVVLESQIWNLGDFIGSKNNGISAAVDLASYFETSELLGGSVYFFFTPWTPLRIFNRLKDQGILLPSLPPLGSVSLSAVELAKRLGSGPVFTGGIDFSYTLDSLHARSSPSHQSLLLTQNRFTSRFNAESVFRPGVFNTISKQKNSVRSDPAMRNYRNLFEHEFSGSRIMDISGNGLYLGIETLSIDEAIKVLMNNNEQTLDQESMLNKKNQIMEFNKDTILNFIKQEKAMLEKLLVFLTNSSEQEKIEKKEFDTMLNDLDYLWAHFPDCAGSEGKRPPANDLFFLKRVRAEIDPFIKLWELAKKLVEDNIAL